MRRFLILLLTSYACATTTVTGTLQNLGTGTVAGGSQTFIRAWLRNCGGNQPMVNGTAIIAPQIDGNYYFDFTPNASGVISGTLYSTRDSTGLLAGDISCGGSSTAPYYGIQVYNQGSAGPEQPVHARNTVTLNLTNFTPITTLPVVTAPTGDTTYLRTDGGNAPASLNLSGTALTASSASISGSLNNVFFAATTGDVGAAINAKDTAIGSGVPGVIEVSPFTTATATTPIVLSKSHALRIRGNGTLTVTGSGATPAIQVPDSTTDTTGISEIECPEHAVIKLAASSNSSIIQDQNFITLSGSGNHFGTFKFTLKGCQLDGNKANQTALSTTSTGTILNVARSAGGVVTINLTAATTPVLVAGQVVCIGTCTGTGTQVTTDGFSFNGRFIVQSVTNAGATFTYNNVGNTVGQTAIGGTAIGFSGASGVRIYGRSNKFEDNVIANNILDGLWSEGLTPSSFTDDTSQYGNTFRGNKLMNSGGDGFIFKGPDQSHSWDLESFGHGQWGREIFSFGMLDEGVTSFLNTSGSTHIGFGGGIQQSNGQETGAGAGSFGILDDNGTQGNVFSSDVASCNTCTALEVRSAGQVFTGAVQNSSIGIKLNGGNVTANVFASANTTFLDCTSMAAGASIITGINADATGSLASANCAAGGNATGLVRFVNFWGGGGKTNFNFPQSSIYNTGTGFAYTFSSCVSSPCLLPSLNPGGTQTWTNNLNQFNAGVSSTTYATNTNCASSGGTCASASAGSVTIAAAATTVTVATTRVTANSEIIITRDNSLGTALGVTCNTQSSLVLGMPYVSARTAATSFVITVDVAPTTNPLCLSYAIVN